MKHSLLLTVLISLMSYNSLMGQIEQTDPYCSTQSLDSAQAVALPYYGNNRILENYLSQNGYNNLKNISFPSPIANSTTFLEPRFLVPLNLYIYRNGANNPGSAITEDLARAYVCGVNEIYRNSGTAIQFYVNRIEFLANNFFHNQISNSLHVYDMWSARRVRTDNSKGINLHFIRQNNPPENNGGKASLPHYPVPPRMEYSLYVRTHDNTSNIRLGDENIVGTLAHEIGHSLGLLHTHHPGRLASLATNQQNATISNGCYQESVSRTRTNRTADGCFSTNNKRKCEINGDFLCDTEADPRQSRRVTNCTYNLPANGNYRVDNWNELWTPPVNNVMSYTTDDCRNQFSRGQIAIMWMQMQHFQNFIKYKAPTISDAKVCHGSPKDIVLTNFPADASVTWEARPASLVSTASGRGSTARISAANSSSRGLVTITFTIIGPGNCYIAQATKDIQVGPYSTSQIRVSGQVQVCGGNQYVYTATPNLPGHTYSWTYPSNWTKISQSGNQITLYTPQYSTPDGGPLQVSINNGCGPSYYSGFTVYPGYSCNSGSFSYSSYPNPAKEHLTIEQILVEDTTNNSISNQFLLEITSTQSTSKEDDFTVTLYDKNQKVVSSGKSKKRKATIDTRNLTAGIYYLQIFHKDVITQKQIVIEK
jgi:hypothetical protein